MGDSTMYGLGMADRLSAQQMLFQQQMQIIKGRPLENSQMPISVPQQVQGFNTQDNLAFSNPSVLDLQNSPFANNSNMTSFFSNFYNNIQNQMTQKLAEINQKIKQQSQERLNQVSTDLNSVRGERQGLQNQVSQLESEIQNLQAQQGGLEPEGRNFTLNLNTITQKEEQLKEAKGKLTLAERKEKILEMRYNQFSSISKTIGSDIGTSNPNKINPGDLIQNITIGRGDDFKNNQKTYMDKRFASINQTITQQTQRNLTKVQNELDEARRGRSGAQEGIGKLESQIQQAISQGTVMPGWAGVTSDHSIKESQKNLEQLKSSFIYADNEVKRLEMRQNRYDQILKNISTTDLSTSQENLTKFQNDLNEARIDRQNIQNQYSQIKFKIQNLNSSPASNSMIANSMINYQRMNLHSTLKKLEKDLVLADNEIKTLEMRQNQISKMNNSKENSSISSNPYKIDTGDIIRRIIGS